MTCAPPRGLRIGITIVEKGSTDPAGVHRYAANVVRALRRQNDIESIVVFTHRNGALYEFLDSPLEGGVECVGYNPRFDNSFAVILWHIAILPYLAKKHRLDVVHVTNGRIFGPRLGNPFVVTLHDVAELEIEGKFDALRTFYRHRLQHPFMRRQPMLLTVSDSAHDDIVRHMGDHAPPIHVIPNYAVLEKGSSRQSSEPYFVYLGRIDHPSKNLVTLIEAFDEAASLYPNLRLLLAGSDSWGAEIVRGAVNDAKHSAQIEMMGWVPESELAELLAGAVALCMPSLHEGFGLPVAEALAVGTPVLAAHAGSLPEVLGTTAGLLPPEQPSAWARAITELAGSQASRNALLDVQLKAQGNVGSEAAERVGRALLQAYRRAISLA